MKSYNTGAGGSLGYGKDSFQEVILVMYLTKDAQCKRTERLRSLTPASCRHIVG